MCRSRRLGQRAADHGPRPRNQESRDSGAFWRDVRRSGSARRFEGQIASSEKSIPVSSTTDSRVVPDLMDLLDIRRIQAQFGRSGSGPAARAGAWRRTYRPLAGQTQTCHSARASARSTPCVALFFGLHNVHYWTLQDRKCLTRRRLA
jgi:hypothetical protein